MEKRFVSYIIGTNEDLKKILKDKKYSPERLAKKMGIGKDTIHDLLNNKFYSLDLLIMASVCLSGLPVEKAYFLIEDYHCKSHEAAMITKEMLKKANYKIEIEGITRPISEVYEPMFKIWNPPSVDNNDE